MEKEATAQEEVFEVEVENGSKEFYKNICGITSQREEAGEESKPTARDYENRVGVKTEKEGVDDIMAPLPAGLESEDDEDAVLIRIENLSKILRKINKAEKDFKSHRQETLSKLKLGFEEMQSLLSEKQESVEEAINLKFQEAEEVLLKDKSQVYGCMQSSVSDIGGGKRQKGGAQEQTEASWLLPSITMNFEQLKSSLNAFVNFNEKELKLSEEDLDKKLNPTHCSTPTNVLSSEVIKPKNKKDVKGSSLNEKTKETNHRKSRMPPISEKYGKMLSENRIKKLIYRSKNWNLSAADFITTTQDRIIIADNTECSIKVFSWEGKKEIEFPTRTESDSEVPYISGLAMTSNEESGELVCSDRQNNCLKMYSRSGKLLARAGRFGRLSGEFISPEGLVLHDHSIYVCDFGNNRIVSVNLRDIRGPSNLFRHHKVPGYVFGPSDVTLDQKQRLAVTEWGKNRLIVKSLSGETYLKVGTDGSELNGPSGIQVDPEGNYFVADALNHKIKVFNKYGHYEGGFKAWTHSAEVHCLRFKPLSSQLCVVDYSRGSVIIFAT